MQTAEQIKKTPLYETHVRLGAKMAEFGGFLMPIQYTNIIEEHLATRQKAGLFDVSHMGQILVTGKGAEEFLFSLISGDPRKLSDGRTLYTLLCNEKGGIIDDLIVYRMDRARFMLVVNASNIQKDFNWILLHSAGRDVTCQNLSDAISLVALQGPEAELILRCTPYQQGSDLKRNRFVEFETGKEKILISRTGYTGEGGFEIYVSSRYAPELWKRLLEAGRDFGLKPVGLGARDTLRLEASLPLYGHDIDDETSPFEAGLGWTVALEKKEFIGKEALLKVKEKGIQRQLVGFEMVDRGIPRQGYTIWGDEPIGKVTSGSYSPTLKKNIGLGYVPVAESVIGNDLFIEIRASKLKARIVETPFYRRSHQ